MNTIQKRQDIKATKTTKDIQDQNRLKLDRATEPNRREMVILSRWVLSADIKKTRTAEGKCVASV